MTRTTRCWPSLVSCYLLSVGDGDRVADGLQHVADIADDQAIRARGCARTAELRRASRGCLLCEPWNDRARPGRTGVAEREPQLNRRGRAGGYQRDVDAAARGGHRKRVNVRLERTVDRRIQRSHERLGGDGA